MTIEELRAILHALQLDIEPEQGLIYVFYQTPDGLVNNFSISLHSARTRSRRPMTVGQLAALMQGYPDARQGKLLAVEHPQQGLSQWLDSSEVCRRLRISRQTLRRWVKRGWLKASRLGAILYYNADDVEQLLRSNRIQPNGRLDQVG